MPVLGAMRNLSFGRVNDENKLMIVREKGLEELMMALKMSRVMEVRICYRVEPPNKGQYSGWHMK